MASEEAVAIASNKTAQANAAAAGDRRRTAEANAKAQEDKLAAAKLAKERAEEERRTAEANAEAKKVDNERLRMETERDKTLNDTKRAEAAKARDEREKAQADKEAAAAKAKAEADKLATEKLKADKIIAEATVLQLRQNDYETLLRELAEWKRDLEERERALTPELTVSDLSWAGGTEDTIIDAEGNLKKQVKEPYDPEKDPKLPQESRKLARAERETREKAELAHEKTKSKVVASLEKLYELALREDRPIDADFYKQTLKSLYPDWEYKAK